MISNSLMINIIEIGTIIIFSMNILIMFCIILTYFNTKNKKIKFKNPCQLCIIKMICNKKCNYYIEYKNIEILKLMLFINFINYLYIITCYIKLPLFNDTIVIILITLIICILFIKNSMMYINSINTLYYYDYINYYL